MSFKIIFSIKTLSGLEYVHAIITTDRAAMTTINKMTI